MILTSAVLLLASSALAQEQVTVVQRDGTKVSGRFEDWNRDSDLIYVRVTPSDQRRITMRNVLVLEVAGAADSLPASETVAARGADHVLVTRSGEVLKGRLLNIEGGQGSSKEDEPRAVSFRAGSERRFPMAQVARVYLGNYPMPSVAPPAAPAPAEAPPGAIRMPAMQRWTATNVTVRRGDRVQFSVQGEIHLSADASDTAGPAGSATGRMAPNAPAPELPVGALIGRIGSGVPFGIGNQTGALPMPAEGPLWLGINDDAMADNQGEFVVTIRVTRGR